MEKPRAATSDAAAADTGTSGASALRFRPTGVGLVERPVLVAREQVAFLRYVLEAHDGLAFMHGDGSGVVLLLTSESQAAGLDALIADLEAEGLVVQLR